MGLAWMRNTIPLVSALALAAVAGADYVPGSLKAHWKFLETAGTSFADNSALGSDGSISLNGEPPTFVPAGGQFGGALVFDGLDDFAWVSDSSLGPVVI